MWSGPGRLEIKVAPAVGARIIELARAYEAHVIGGRPTHADHLVAMALFQIALGRLQRIERNDRIQVMRCVLHQAMKQQIDRFGKTDSDGAAQLLIGRRGTPGRHRPFDLRSGVLDDGDERNEEIPDEERYDESEESAVGKRRAERRRTAI